MSTNNANVGTNYFWLVLAWRTYPLPTYYFTLGYFLFTRGEPEEFTCELCFIYVCNNTVLCPEKGRQRPNAFRMGH
jgi:hypothetical protein